MRIEVRTTTLTTRLLIAALLTAGTALPTSAITWYVDGAVAESGDGRSWETARKTINRALESADPGDTVFVATGTYAKTVTMPGDNITLRSRDPGDPAVVRDTIIAPDLDGPAVTFTGNEGATCVLEGFTITHGADAIGPGIDGNGTVATIRNNVITRNTGPGSDSLWRGAGGGGLVNCHGLIEKNVICDNVAGSEEAAGFGGGLFRCHGAVRNNIIVRNTAIGVGSHCLTPYACITWYGSGAGLSRCHGTVEGNYIAENASQASVGAAIDYCNGTVRANIIVGNSGGALSECDGMIENNLIANNQGRAVDSCYGLIEGCTISANVSGYDAGGIAWSGATIHNCIIWGNIGPYECQLYESSEPAYSCIQDWTGGGEGNINEEPRFVDAENGDFRLLPDSPCIDAGFNSPDLPEFDIAGMRRIMFGGKSLTVDMGAYEFYINKVEPVLGTHEAIFTWSSLSDKTYSIFYSHDLLDWRTAIANFPSSGSQTTSWTDDGSLTGLPPLLAPKRFYRLLENP